MLTNGRGLGRSSLNRNGVDCGSESVRDSLFRWASLILVVDTDVVVEVVVSNAVVVSKSLGLASAIVSLQGYSVKHVQCSDELREIATGGGFQVSIAAIDLEAAEHVLPRNCVPVSVEV